MSVKLFIADNADMLEAQEHHLDAFPTLADFLRIDNRLLKNVQLVAVGDMLPLIKMNLDKSDGVVKWKMDGNDLIDPTCKPLYFAVRIQ